MKRKNQLLLFVMIMLSVVMVTSNALAAQIPMHYDESDSSVSWGYNYCTGGLDFPVDGVSDHSFWAYYDDNGNLKSYNVWFLGLPNWMGVEGVKQGPDSVSWMRLDVHYNANHSFSSVFLDRLYEQQGSGGGVAGAVTLSYEWEPSTNTWTSYWENESLLNGQPDNFDPAAYWAQIGGFDPTKYEIYGSWNGTSAAPSNPTPTPEEPSTPTTGNATLDNAYGKLAIVDANGNLVDYTGFEKFEGADFYFEHGIIRDDMDGLTLIDGTWYNMQQGRFNTADGMVFFEGATFLVKGGVIDETQSGLIEYNGQRFVFSYGQFVSSLYGAWPDPISGRFVYIWAGQFYPITDLVSYDGQIFYFVNGYLATDFVGTVYDFNGTPFNVVYGQVY